MSVEHFLSSNRKRTNDKSYSSVKVFKTSSAKQCLKNQNAHTTHVVSSLDYRISLGTASKHSSLRITRQMTEEKGREDQRVCEKLEDDLTNGENSSQNTSCKYSVGIEHCPFKPFKKSEKPLKKEFRKQTCSCNKKEKIFPITSQILKITESRLQKQCDCKKVEKENKQTENLVEGNASQIAVTKHITCLEKGDDSTNQICFSEQAVTVQAQGVCSSKPETETEVITETGLPTRDQDGYPGITLNPPITTTPIRSGLRLLSMVSVRSAPKVPDSPAVTVETPITLNTPTTAKTTVAAPTTVQAGKRSPITTSQAPKTVDMTSPPPPKTPQSPTIPNVNAPLRSTTITQENTPFATGLPVTMTPPQTPSNVAASIPSPSRTSEMQHQTDTPGPPTPHSFCPPLTTPPFKAFDSTRKSQSEPRFKAWIAPPDTDPMSQTFLRMPFTYQSLQVECNHGNRPHVKRPMNAFMVWAKKNRASIARRFPNASNAEISVRLGHIWNDLPSIEQKPYFDEANELKERHKHDNPNWVYQPRPGKKCRKALFTSATSKSQPTSPVARKIIAKGHDQPDFPPRNVPSSPNVKRPLWLARKTELSEDELQSRIVEDLLDNEIPEEVGTGNPTMDKYIDEWLSPKRSRREGNDLCLMNDAMLPAVNDYEQDILEEETRCDGKDFEKYIKQLKKERNNFTTLENNISNLDDDENECHG